jgi:hypothetical protein
MRTIGAHRWAALATVLATLVLSAAIPGPATPCLAQTPGTAAARPALNGEQLRKILKQLEQAGRTRAIPSKVTAALGITKGEETLDVREIAFEHAEFQHGFYKSLKADDDRIILAFRTPDKQWTAFLTNSRFQLIAAVNWNAGETPVPSQGAEANQAFENELAYWAVLADTF